MIITLLTSVGGVLTWLDLLYIISYIKLAVTVVKYLPQVSSKLDIIGRIMQPTIIILSCHIKFCLDDPWSYGSPEGRVTFQSISRHFLWRSHHIRITFSVSPLIILGSVHVLELRIESSPPPSLMKVFSATAPMHSWPRIAMVLLGGCQNSFRVAVRL